MTDDADKTSGTASRPRKRATVIEGEAREISGAAEKPEMSSEAKPEAAAEPKAERKIAAPNFDWRVLGAAVLVAAVSGVGAGMLGVRWFSPGVPQAADTSAIEKTVAQLTSRLAQQESKTPPPMPDLAPLNERSEKLASAIGELRGDIGEIKKRVEAQASAPTAAELNAVNRRLAQIEEKIGALAATPTPEARSDTQSAEVVSLGALNDAIASGGPFVGELNAVRALMKERAAPLAALDKYAQRGLPTVLTLARQFESLAAKIARPPKPEDSGVFTRLWSNAGKLVDVRPIGEPQGSEPDAIVARMESKLARGDLAGALEDSRALPETARAQAKEWFAAAEQRHSAEIAIKTLIGAALAALSVERPKQ